MHDTSSNVRTLQDILNSNTWPSAQEDDDDTNIVQQFDNFEINSEYLSIDQLDDQIRPKNGIPTSL